MTEHEFTLADRVAKIQSINKLYDLENNAYISFSGGKDSTVLHHLIDEALPGNKIPRVYINTGIEYKKVVAFVEREREKDERIIIITPSQNIKETLEKYGYPFKSKEHCERLQAYRNGNRSTYLLKYFNIIEGGYRPCPQKLMYQLEPSFNLNISKECCNRLKKIPLHKYEKQNNRTIAITGMLREEGGQRRNITCITTDSRSGSIKKFHPLSVVSKDFEEWYIKQRNIKLCELYYPPYNFERTGCKGCPYSLHLQEQLNTMAILLPAEKKQCEMIWKPVYEEYRRIGYRLRKKDNSQPSLFEDFD